VRIAGLALAAACSFTPRESHGDAEILDAGPDAATCPTGYIALAGTTSHYRAMPGASFDTAVATCAAAGTHLVELDDQAEADAVFELVDSMQPNNPRFYRVVATREVSGQASSPWVDLTGNPLPFLPWGIGEPTNGPGENCALLRLETTGSPPAKVIGADQCTPPYPYACECD
jgi:hypothetical protein